jgi:hypothetical protein
MTNPLGGEDIGRAEIEVHADTTPFPGEAKRGVERAFEDIDPSVKKTGEHWGESLSENLSRKLESEAPKVARDLEHALDRETVHQHIKVVPDYDKSQVRTVVHGIATEVEKGLTEGLQSSGVFSKIGAGIQDAVGAAFNVSGKSPLIALLIPVIGGIAGLILAAVQAVYELSAALFTLPTILAAIIAQAGVLFLIFKAVAPVISAVLSAQNAKELQIALMGVAPPIAEFAKSLIPIRDFFDLLSKSAAVAFFRELGNTLSLIFNANSREFFFGVIKVAGALGDWFKVVGKAFQSPVFTKFLKDLFDSIAHFLERDGPYFEVLLEKFFQFLDMMIGPATDLGAIFDLLLIKIGEWFDMLKTSPDFNNWLERLPLMLIDVGDAIGSVLELIGTLFKDIDEEGGADFLNNFTVAVKELNLIFESDAGKQAIKVLIQAIEILSLSFFGLIVVIISVLAFFGKLEEGVKWIADRIRDFFHWISSGSDEVRTLPDKIGQFFEGLIRSAPDWGRRLMQGFIDGIMNMLGPLGRVLAFIGKQISDHLVTHSPAKVGPLSMGGGPEGWGANLVKGFAKGIMAGGDQVNTAVNSVASDINFGPGSVIATFNGSNPTPSQAAALGQALGGGIIDQLTARNARLAVRTM